MAYALIEEPIVLDLCQKRGLRVLPGPIRPSDASQHVCDRRVRGIEALSRHPVCRRNRGHSAIEGRDDTSLATPPHKIRPIRLIGALRRRAREERANWAARSPISITSRGSAGRVSAIRSPARKPTKTAVLRPTCARDNRHYRTLQTMVIVGRIAGGTSESIFPRASDTR